MTPAALKLLFAHRAWAHGELFQALAGVSVAVYPMELHTALRTLNHVHVVDRIFCAHLLGRPHGYQSTNTPDTPTLPDLRSAMAATDAWYEHYVENVAMAQLVETVEFAFTDGDCGRMTREEILLHLITHGSYHRGTVGQLLKSISVPAPRDVLTHFLHRVAPNPSDEPDVDD